MATRAHSSQPNGPTRAAVYCRVSGSGQEDNYSLGTQEGACRAYAAERGWVVVGVYREVHTGGELFERPQLGRLREALRGGEAEIVLAHALDRVSRNQSHLGFLLSEWDHLGIRLALVSEELDETPEGRLLQSVRSFVAEVERLKIRERTQRGLRARVAAGKPLVGCRAPFGYRWRDPEKTGLDFDPERAPIVRRIFDAALRGDSLRSIARALTGDGVPTPTGRGTHWEPSVLYRILTHPIYAGKPAAYRYVKERTPGTKSRVRPRAEADHVALPAGVVPPIVEPKEQEAVLARLEANKLRATRNNRSPEETLLRAGFARCGYCGSPLSVKQRTDRADAPTYRCVGIAADRYGCPGFAISSAVLDQAVWSRVERVLREPEIIAREVERRRDRDPIAADVEALDRRLQEVTTRQTKLARLATALEDEDAAEPLLGELRSLAAQKRELAAERRRLAALVDTAVAETDRLAGIASWCRRVAANLMVLTYEQKRLILEALGVHVRVWRADHGPRWELSMSLPIDEQATAPTSRGEGTPIVLLTRPG